MDGKAAPPGTSSQTASQNGAQSFDNVDGGDKDSAVKTPIGSAYDKIDDVAKLQRLVNAKEKTRGTLETRAAWVGAETTADEAT